MKEIKVPIIPSKEYTTISHQKACPIHRHTNCELLFVLSGSIDNSINNMKVAATTGDIIFINDRVNHTIVKTSESYSQRDVYISSANLQEICTTYFDLDFFNYLMSTVQTIQIHTTPELFFSYAQRLQKLQAIADLSAEQKAFAKKAIRIIIISLLGILYEQKQEEAFDDTQNWLQAFLVKIQPPEIFCLPIDEIIKLSNYSHSYFSHHFKKTFQITFKTYINKLRIRYAKSLLSNLKLTIADVAYISGYSNQSHFTQLFKDSTGETPTEYRNKLIDSAPTQVIP